jgi:DNA-binding transcriptional MocR family regulator
MADAYGVPILEDDPYGSCASRETAAEPLQAIDAARFPENAAAGAYVRGNVIHLGSFSKNSGARAAGGLGRLSARDRPADRHGQAGADLHTNAISQAMASSSCGAAGCPPQVERIRRTYLERRNAMLEAMEEFFPRALTWTRPQGGLFLWNHPAGGEWTPWPYCPRPPSARSPSSRGRRSSWTGRGATRFG